MTPPFSAVSKSFNPPSVSTPLNLANFWQVPNIHNEKVAIGKMYEKRKNGVESTRGIKINISASVTLV